MNRKLVRALSIALASSLLGLTSLSAQATGAEVGTFTNNQWQTWQEHSFSGHTQYRLEGNSEPFALEASCTNGASAMYLDIDIDLTKTPVLRWSWRVDGVQPSLNDLTKAGDDYAARLYVVYSPSQLMPWRTKAVDYVWANSQPTGSTWPNAFTGNAIMVALQSGQPAEASQWIEQSRNVRDDFRNLLGLELNEVSGVALMTDCDNARLPMRGYYRNIRFTEE